METREKHHFFDPPVKQLMQRRIREILLVCSSYDSFMLQEDGRVDEQIFREYVSLNLRYPPHLTEVFDEAEALKALNRGSYDLVISVINVGGPNTTRLIEKIHALYPIIPVVTISPVPYIRSGGRPGSIGGGSTRNFAWLGDDGILLAIVKLMEDRMNVDFDVKVAGIQVIILVENSVRFYSGYLPVIYRALIYQAQNLMEEGLNEWEQTMRMRCRPKILLATNYEEAVQLYQRYSGSMLGVITDVSFPRNGVEDPLAGFELCKSIREKDSVLPVLIQSSNLEHERVAKTLDAEFLHKGAKDLLGQIHRYVRQSYGFGEFHFHDPDTGKTIETAADLRELHSVLPRIPDNSIVYHFSRDHISRWLRARALFSLADAMGSYHPDLSDPDSSRRGAYNLISEFRNFQCRGKIARFDTERYDEYTSFARIGAGSLGGKGRGLAFIDRMLTKVDMRERYPGVVIDIPRSIVLSTDLFVQFIDDDRIKQVLSESSTDQEILDLFVSVELDEEVRRQLKALLEIIERPLAVRSSSLLEDSCHQPFAGIYNTFLISNSSPSLERRLQSLEGAIKSVYASTYFRAARRYRGSVEGIVADENMGVIVQEITGTIYKNRCYPTISGVARSLNYYPSENEESEDGVAYIAIGLGKSVVDGAPSVQFNPSHPESALQLTDLEAAIRTTQTHFYALPLSDDPFVPSIDDSTPLVRLSVREAEEDPSFAQTVSTYDRNDKRIRDGWFPPGRPLVTMAGLLKHPPFPLAEIVRELLTHSAMEMGVPVEIEFAVDLNPPPGEPIVFSFLQVRPTVSGSEESAVVLEGERPEECIIYTQSVLGNGHYNGVSTVIYVSPACFDPSKSREIAATIGEVNRRLDENGGSSLLMVPGRLGSRDPWMGIPVAWNQISTAKLICEYELTDFAVDPSQGSHFFHNISSQGIGYLTVRRGVEDKIDFDYLDKHESMVQEGLVRSVTFSDPLEALVDGQNRIAVIRYPGKLV